MAKKKIPQKVLEAARAMELDCLGLKPLKRNHGAVLTTVRNYLVKEGIETAGKSVIEVLLENNLIKPRSREEKFRLETREKIDGLLHELRDLDLKYSARTRSGKVRKDIHFSGLKEFAARLERLDQLFQKDPHAAMRELHRWEREQARGKKLNGRGPTKFPEALKKDKIATTGLSNREADILFRSWRAVNPRKHRTRK